LGVSGGLGGSRGLGGSWVPAGWGPGGSRPRPPFGGCLHDGSQSARAKTRGRALSTRGAPTTLPDLPTQGCGYESHWARAHKWTQARPNAPSPECAAASATSASAPRVEGRQGRRGPGQHTACQRQHTQLTLRAPDVRASGRTAARRTRHPEQPSSCRGCRSASAAPRPRSRPWHRTACR